MSEFFWAGEDRLSDIISLWKQGFTSDSEEEIRDFFYTMKDEARCFCLQENDEIRSMTFVIPATMNGLTVWYVYAAATACAYRGQGCFAALLEELVCRAKDENVCGLFLRPATQSLFSYYARLGFVSIFYSEEISCEVDHLYIPETDISWQRVEENGELQRERWLSLLGIPSVTWSKTATAYAQSLLKDGGMLVSDKGLVMYQRECGTVEISELLCADEDVSDVLHSLSRYFACQITRVSRPSVTPENAKVYGMFRTVGTLDVTSDVWYMGFSLE